MTDFTTLRGLVDAVVTELDTIAAVVPTEIEVVVILGRGDMATSHYAMEDIEAKTEYDRWVAHGRQQGFEQYPTNETATSYDTLSERLRLKYRETRSLPGVEFPMVFTPTQLSIIVAGLKGYRDRQLADNAEAVLRHRRLAEVLEKFENAIPT